jgi:hypothetical protein
MTAAAHKIMLPFAPQVLSLFAPLTLIPIVGGTLAAVTTFFFPTIFGFFGWELKENYKLYRASRNKTLPESVIGAPRRDDERLPRGRLPLRHAAEALRAPAPRGAPRGRGGAPPRPEEHERRRRKDEGARGRFREGTHEVEVSVRRFVEREMLSLLVADPRWTHGPLRVREGHRQLQPRARRARLPGRLAPHRRGRPRRVDARRGDGPDEPSHEPRGVRDQLRGAVELRRRGRRAGGLRGLRSSGRRGCSSRTRSRASTSSPRRISCASRSRWRDGRRTCPTTSPTTASSCGPALATRSRRSTRSRTDASVIEPALRDRPPAEAAAAARRPRDLVPPPAHRVERVGVRVERPTQAETPSSRA